MALYAALVTAVAIVLAVLVVRTRAHATQVAAAAAHDAAQLRADVDAAIAGAANMQRAVDALPLGVIMCDDSGAIVYTNVSASRFATGRHTEVMVSAAIDDLLQGALAGVSARRTLEQYGPPQRTLVLSAWPLDSDQPSAGAVVLIDDVSERRRLEAVRRDFVANISHELKTPVGAISLLAETLLGEDDREVLGRLAERILTEALRVGRTIDDLLELSRIEIDEAPEHDVVRVDDVVNEALQRIRPAAEQHDITLHADSVDTDVTVLGDRRQLVSALYNLVDNAVKYSEPRSSVEITVTADQRAVDIAVRDHGVGIPSRDLDRIFERFYRVDRARSRETGGTGLGLAIVRHVAVNHDGDVRVESQQGGGSTFTLTLPRHHDTAPSPARSEPVTERSRS